jgi:uncharacterized protein YqgC (DUF456 family)
VNQLHAVRVVVSLTFITCYGIVVSLTIITMNHVAMLKACHTRGASKDANMQPLCAQKSAVFGSTTAIPPTTGALIMRNIQKRTSLDAMSKAQHPHLGMFRSFCCSALLEAIRSAALALLEVIKIARYVRMIVVALVGLEFCCPGWT